MEKNLYFGIIRLLVDYETLMNIDVEIKSYLLSVQFSMP